MKNQYFADVGDYGKYGLLRFIAECGVKIAVNWYLTPKDHSNDGNKREYLANEKNRKYGPELFDVLREMNEHKDRNVGHFAERGLIPGAIYFDNIVRPLPSESTISVTEKRLAREHWHQQALAGCLGAELVFMDPDNGLRTGSPTARKDAQKFVYASEVYSYYNRGQDVVYYCHKGRRTDTQWKKAKCVMQECCPDAAMLGITYHRGTQRSYIFVLHPEKEEFYRGLLNDFLKTAWKECFTEEIIGKR